MECARVCVVVGWRHAHTLLRRLGIGDAVLSADVRRAGFLRVLFHGPRVQLVYYYYCFLVGPVL